jgi:Cu/Zn superoxide dismutase
MSLRKFTMISASAVVAAVLSAIPAAADELDGFGARLFQGQLTKLNLAAPNTFDGAEARLLMVTHGGATTFVLRIQGVDPSAAWTTFGAHLHTGPCVYGNGPAAGPHYNQDIVTRVVPVRVNDTTEVWLDFTVGPTGTATSVTTVPFVPTPGTRSVVIHAEPTNHQTGLAGSRLACLPVAW